MLNGFFSLRWRPTTWWGPANPPSLWRLSASLESSDMSSGRQFSIWAAPKMLLEFISINFFRNKDKIITNKQVSFPLVETTISHQERKHLDIAARLGTCWGQNIIQKITLKPLFLIWPPPGWSHAEDKIEPRQRGWGGCRYAQTHHCCQNIWEIECWMYQHCHKRFASNNSRSWCPWLPVPGRCQELLPSTVWSHKMIWHGVRNWYHLCSIVEQMIFLMSSNNSRSRCPCPRQCGTTRWSDMGFCGVVEQMIWANVTLYIPCVK